MTAPKFTPGPWSEVSAQIRAASGSVVCEVFSQPADAGKRYGYGVSDANAALIAAAPELYAALERCLPLLVQLGDFIGNGPVDPSSPASLGERCDAILQARAALGKAVPS